MRHKAVCRVLSVISLLLVVYAAAVAGQTSNSSSSSTDGGGNSTLTSTGFDTSNSSSTSTTEDLSSSSSSSSSTSTNTTGDDSASSTSASVSSSSSLASSTSGVSSTSAASTNAASTSTASTSTASTSAASTSAASTSGVSTSTASTSTSSTASTSGASTSAASAASAASTSTASLSSSTSGSTTGPVYVHVTQNTNCLAARLDFLWREAAININITTDPFIYASLSSGYLNATLCTSSPDPIYMNDPRCQCDAAVDLYLATNVSATASNAFASYAAAIESLTFNAPTWHCEACPNTVVKKVNNYVHLTSNCTCMAARLDYLARNTDVEKADDDPVYHYDHSGALNGRVWNCAECDSLDRIYIDDPICVNCTEALTTFVQMTFYAGWFNDTYLAYWNSFLTVGKPIYHCEYCLPISTPTTTTGPTAPFIFELPTVINNSAVNTCMAARFQYWFANSDVYKALDDPVGHFSDFGYKANPPRIWPYAWCSFPGIPNIYINDSIARCTTAQRYYYLQYVSEGADTYADPFEHYAMYYLTSPTHMWHAESCPGVVAKIPDQQTKLPETCTCLAARLAYWQQYPPSQNNDPVYHYNTVGAASGYNWDCGLCSGTSVVFIDDSICQNCAPAQTKYLNVSSSIGSSYYYDTFLHYWNGYMYHGLPWHCELCVNATTLPIPTTTGGGGITTGASSTTGGQPMGLPDSCRCLQAQNQYLLDYASVRIDASGLPLDPVKHYLGAGQYEGFIWKCDLCDVNPIYMNESCNCSAAQILFVNTYPSVGTTPAEAFAAYLADTTGTLIWPCSACPLPIRTLNTSCDCIAARADYLYRYPEVQANSPYYVDPLYYYEWIGFSVNQTWGCSLCPTATPAAPLITPASSVCNCPEALAQYYVDYPNSVKVISSPHGDYVANSHSLGMVWRCDLCSNTHPNPVVSLLCNCTAARALYNATYRVSTDPWTHYNTIGQNVGFVWDCGICNDTCHGTLADPNAWTYNNRVFGVGAAATVAAGCYIPWSSQTLNVYSLNVLGSLRCVENNASVSNGLSLQKITVSGTMRCGNPQSAFLGNLNIVIAGTPQQRPSATFVAHQLPEFLVGVEATSASAGWQYKGITVQAGGYLYLHGSRQVTWTTLATPAQPGNTQISVDDAVDWQVGDQIVVATTSNYGDVTAQDLLASNEVRTIVAINGTGITLDSALKYAHLSEAHALPFSTQSAPLTFTRKAEVALLSRNIVIQGDPTSDSSQFGVHVGALAGGQVFVSGVLITLAGQLINSIYPVHWDNAGNSTGQYLQNSTIVDSYYGCVGLASTTSATVSDNLCYSFQGNGFVSDQNSTLGVFDSNLAIPAVPTSTANNGSPSAMFLLQNPTNSFTNNVAVGSTGYGYWLQFLSDNTSDENLDTWGIFTSNMAHSISVGFTSCPNDEVTGNTWTIEALTVYGAATGVFPCGTEHLFEDLVVVETRTGFQSNSKHSITNAAFVSRIDSTSSLPNATTAIALLDNGWALNRVLFQNYDQYPQYSVFSLADSDSFSTLTSTANIDLVNSPILLADPLNVTYYRSYQSQWGKTIFDADGTLTGHEQYTLVTSHPMMIDISCVQVGGPFAYACPFNYSQLNVVFDVPGLPIAALGRYSFQSKRAVVLPDGLSVEQAMAAAAAAAASSDPSAVYFPSPGATAYSWPVIVNSQYVYTFLMPLTDSKIIQISVPGSNAGDSIGLEFDNVNFASGFLGGSIADSCSQVLSSSSTPSHSFSFSSSQMCVRLVANTKLSDGSFAASLSLTAVAANNSADQPAPPFSDGPYALPTVCTCIGAMLDYWSRYPNVSAANIDPIYHYQEIGGPESLTTWDCSSCQSHAHYVTELYCNCTAARANYTDLYSAELNATHTDPYLHYLLYHLEFGYGYHCELCTPPPEQSSSEAPVYRNLDVALSAALGAVVAVCIIVDLFAIVMLGMKLGDYSAHGYFYSALIMTGVLLSYISALVLLPQPTDNTCLAFPWLLGIGFTFVYGCLFIKTWALYQVWSKAEQFKKSTLTPGYILRGIGIYVVIEVIILIIWSAVDRPTAGYSKMVDGTLQLQCRTQHPTFWIIFLVTKGVWLLFGAALSVLTRRVAAEFSHSKSIAYSISAITSMLIIAVPLAVELETIPGGVLVIEVGVIVIAFTFTLISLFFDVWYGYFFPGKEMSFNLSRLGNLRANVQSNASTTQSTKKSSSSGSSGESGSGSGSGGGAASSSAKHKPREKVPDNV